MRLLVVLSILLSTAGCGTFGGAVKGLGSDLDLVGSYITDF